MLRRAALYALAFVFLGVGAADIETSAPRPKGLPEDWEAEPLGWVRVTKYTHVETNSRLTSSGYLLKDQDAGLVCAISRDWWRSRVKPGDLVWVAGFAQPCAALDTMALKNSKGFAQTRWIDIYVTDPNRALDFGIRKSSAYLIRPKGTPKGVKGGPRNPAAARELRHRINKGSRAPVEPTGLASPVRTVHVAPRSWLAKWLRGEPSPRG